MKATQQGVMRAADREIIATRVFDAPRELVFKAWTDPRHVAQWWGPHGFTNPACEIDLRVGGIFRLQMRAPDGVIYPCEGVFTEVVEPERIVYASLADQSHACGGGLPPHATVTVTFSENDGKTTVTVHTRLASAADLEAAVRMGFDTGWAASLERLAEFLAKA